MPRALQVPKSKLEPSGCYEVSSNSSNGAVGSSGGFLGRKPFRNSDPSAQHPPFPRPQKAGCHGCCPESPGDPVAQSQAWVSGGRACHHEAQNNLLSVASLPLQRPNWSGRGPSPRTLKGPMPALRMPLSAFEDFISGFCPEIYSEGLLLDTLTTYLCSSVSPLMYRGVWGTLLPRLSPALVSEVA